MAYRAFSNASTSRQPSHPLMSSLPSLSEIIDVDPSASDFTCVGYAPSQRRRCHNPIHRDNRSAAESILAEGDEELQQGGFLEDFLMELAPRVLCKRWHQGQVNTIVSGWMKRVSAFN